MRARCHGPGVQVVASVPCAGPVPPPSMVVMPDISASSICCGQMKWICASKPPAVRILPSPAIDLGARADDDGDAGLRIGIAGLADRSDAPVLEADIGLVDAGMVDDQRVGDDRIDRASGARHLALAHAVADHLAAAELHLLAIDGEILLHLDEELGVGKTHPVADGRAEHLGIGGAGDFRGHEGSLLTAAAVEFLRVGLMRRKASQGAGRHRQPGRAREASRAPTP